MSFFGQVVFHCVVSWWCEGDFLAERSAPPSRLLPDEVGISLQEGKASKHSGGAQKTPTSTAAM